jgi:predicted TIM-barrel fold metal-dependent hydrolase
MQTKIDGGPNDVLDKLRVIDCDAHFTEPADLWSARAPAGLRDKLPTLRTESGISSWLINDTLWASTGGNVIRKEGKVRGTVTTQPFDAIDPSAWSVPERLKAMDEMGLYAQIVYPNGIGFSSNHIFAIEEENIRRAVLQIYNDFLVDIQNESNGRLQPQAMLPIWDMEFTTQEMTRLLDRGISGFTLSDKPELLGLPELIDPYFTPMWDVFNESGAVANFHIASGFTRQEIEERRNPGLHKKDPTAMPASPGRSWEYFGRQRSAAVSSAQLFMSNARIICNLCMSDLFDRFPRLKIVSAESGIGWIPFILETLEYQLDELVTDPDECSQQKRRPTEYFRDHLFVTFWYETLGPAKLIEDVGVRNVMIETDYPHPTCLFPGTAERLAMKVSMLDSETRKRVVQDNAAELYGIALP